ncbi:MAG TPA: dihydrodipicolinate synthase family protein [Acidimicrobiaceae bacterium]|nr:dihydrodipicolinate synthase family protein [Acidimicrobiaceae bacterium]HAQ24234.1 dihydrodipicolinate synthase family protein [Acidimicrobiaceae bacterium]HCV33620.1 dihydrodipicolinate synthase family protein [Acidimicrobiaceae bacterium]
MSDGGNQLLAPGVVAPILTPFEADGTVSHPRIVDHARRLLKDGCVGLAVFGTTGEALSVAARERTATLEALIEGGVDPDLLVVGTGLTNLPGTVHLTRHAVDLGCRACMVLPPFYFKDPEEEGLFRHFASLIEKVDDERLRIMLYHIPQVAGVGIPVSLAARLRREFPGTVVAIKDSSGNWANTDALFSIDGMTVYPGAEPPLFDALDMGGPGCITAMANVAPEPVAEAIRHYVEVGREAAGPAMETALAIRLAFQGYLPIPVMKGLLARRLDDPTWSTVRPPFLPTDEETVKVLDQKITKIMAGR